MRFATLLSLALAPLALALPALDAREADARAVLAERFTGESGLSKRATGAGVCNLSTAKMPVATVPLPPPSAGLILQHVALGRGTQNYTCANSTRDAVPVAAGALATLFNVTCLAAPYTPLLQVLPGIALHFPVPITPSLAPVNLFLSGKHYFADLTTPTFDLDAAGHEWGKVGCKKANATDAPTDPKTNVPWLKLTSKSRDGCTISEVYRVNTAGGQPPPTCEGQKPAFEVQYAAEYWMWSNPALGSYS